MISFSNFALLQSSACNLTRNTACLLYNISSHAETLLLLLLSLSSLIIIIINLISESGISIIHLINNLDFPLFQVTTWYLSSSLFYVHIFITCVTLYTQRDNSLLIHTSDYFNHDHQTSSTLIVLTKVTIQWVFLIFPSGFPCTINCGCVTALKDAFRKKIRVRNRSDWKLPWLILV
jgi:hypothetical protein